MFILKTEVVVVKWRKAWIAAVKIFPGLLLVVVYIVLRITRCIRIIHPERIPSVGEKLIVVFNHPGMPETVLLPVVMWESFLRHLWCGEFIIADKKNFSGSWLSLIRCMLIFVDRSGGSYNIAAIRQTMNLLATGQAALIPYEGGRTDNGDEFCHSEKGDKRIRKPKNSVGFWARRTGALVQTVWFDGVESIMPNKPGQVFNVWPCIWNMLCWWRIAVTIKFGERMFFSPHLDKKEITRQVAQRHLALADE